MAGLRLTTRAKADLTGIGAYTRDRWGPEQAVRYLTALDACFHRLVENPLLGRSCDAIRAGYYRFEQGSHVIFFQRPKTGSVLVVRILHARMLAEQHLMGDDE